MNDREKIVDMLARANQYYSITVHTNGCTILTGGGPRTLPMPRKFSVKFEFDTDGNLKDITK